MNRGIRPRSLGTILLILLVLTAGQRGHAVEPATSLEDAAPPRQLAWLDERQQVSHASYTLSDADEPTPSLPPLSQPENQDLADAQYFEQIAPGQLPPGQPVTAGPQWSAGPESQEDAVYEPIASSDEWFSIETHPGVIGHKLHGVLGIIANHGILAGVQGTFLAPIDDGLQAVTMTDLRTDQSYTEESHPGLGGGVRTWLGLQSGKTGFLGTYWGFETAGYAAEPMFIGKGSHGFTRNYWLRANTLDLEFFQHFCLSTCTIQASLGVRYAELQRVSTVMGSGEVGDVSLMGHARGASSLEGWGVTAALAGNIPMKRWFHPDSCCPSPWSFFWRIQGAVLNADTKVQAITQVHAVPPVKTFGAAYSYDEAAVVWSGNVGMGSLQLGLNYAHPLALMVCPAFLNLHAGFEGQIWQTGRGMAVSESNAFLAGYLDHASFGGEVEAYSKVNPSNVELVGFFIGVGLSY